jgi:YHS domain-containing protein
MAGSVKKMFGIAALVLGIALAGMAVPGHLQATEPDLERTWHWKGHRVPVYSDNRTGFAIRGFDPVSYFAEGVAKRGVPKYEVFWQGTYWIFANRGNREAFANNPEIYAPQFGGHAAVSLSQGALAESEPELFIVKDGRLYLFAGTRQRTVFGQDPDYFLELAERQWALKRGIDPQEQAAAIAEAASESMIDSGSEAQAINPEHEKPFIPKL